MPEISYSTCFDAASSPEIKGKDKDYILLKKLKETRDPNCLLFALKEGDYLQFYNAIRDLAESNNYKVNQVILSMINNPRDPWQQALGLIILGSRIKEGKKVTLDIRTATKPFLEKEDPFLSSMAAIALLRSNTQEATNTLKSFISLSPKRTTTKIIGGILNYEASDSYTATLLKGWADPGAFQTAFFRHPQILVSLTNDFKNSKIKPFEVWDIGCSIGLSTESISIVLENALSPGVDFRIIGTDISPFALNFAVRGMYFLRAKSLAAAYGDNVISSLINPDTLAIPFRGKTIDLTKRFTQNITGGLTNLNGPSFSSIRPANAIAFGFDDIGSDASPVVDATIQAAIYTNVHYLLGDNQKTSAVSKIWKKLAAGGKVYVLDPEEKTYTDFKNVFGPPVKNLREVRVYQKSENHTL